MEKENLIEELKQQIKAELDNCNPKLWPRICAMQTTKEGFLKIEENAIRMVAETGMPAGSALAHIENDLEFENA